MPASKKQKSQNNQKKSVSPRKPNGGSRGLKGKYLVKNKEAALREGSQRAKSFSKIHGHMSYEKAVEAGARPQDIRVMVKLGSLKAVSK